MSSSLLVKRYLNAYVNCFESDKQESALTSLNSVVSEIILKSDSLSILSNPSVRLVVKQDLISKLIETKGVDFLKNFLMLIVSKNRSELLKLLPDEIELKLCDIRGVLKATAISSTTLTEQGQSQIVDFLKSYFKKDVDLKISVDESLLAGLKIKSSNIVFDATLDNSLKMLRLAFK